MTENIKPEKDAPDSIDAKEALRIQNWDIYLSPGSGFVRLLLKAAPYGLSVGGAMYLDKPYGWGILGVALGIIIADGFSEHHFLEAQFNKKLREKLLEQKYPKNRKD